MNRPILLFGASFNPPTLAHRAMVDHLHKILPQALIVLAPVYQHRFPSKSGLADYGHRLAMTRLAFPHDFVSELERQVVEAAPAGADIGTVDVLEFMQTHPELFDGDVSRISLVLGGDTFNDFFSGKWKNADRIIDRVESIYAFDREGLTLVPTDCPKVKWQLNALTDPAIKQLSSTEIRSEPERARQGLDPAVFEYILAHRLYYPFL